MTLMDHDLGTPAPRPSSRNGEQPTVDVTIDGIKISVAEGTSVMRAAALAGAAREWPMYESCRRSTWASLQEKGTGVVRETAVEYRLK